MDFQVKKKKWTFRLLKKMDFQIKNELLDKKLTFR